MDASLIVERLYQSSTLDGCSWEEIRALGVQAIFDMEGSLDALVPSDVGNLYVHFPLEDADYIYGDGTELLTLGQFAFDLWSSGLTVLAHCSQGCNRASLITAQVLELSGMSPDEAIGQLRSRRPCALSNETFVEWLRGRRERSPAEAR